jgi:hypothetical protein
MSDVLIRGERQARTGLLWTDYGGHHVTTEAETGVMSTRLRPPLEGRGGPRVFPGSWSPVSDFLLGLLLQDAFLWLFLTAAQEANSVSCEVPSYS